jgi:hypothetical protein
MESSVTEAIDDLATVLAELVVNSSLEREIDRAEMQCEPLNKQAKRYSALLGELENTQQRDKMQNIVTEMLYQYEKAAYHRAGLRDGMSVFSRFFAMMGKESR